MAVVKRPLGLLAALLMLLSLGGCWSRVEIENLAIVTAVGVDIVQVDGREKWRTSFMIIRPGGMSPGPGQGGGGGGGGVGSGAGGREAEWLVSGLGETFMESMLNIDTRSPRLVYLGHASPLILGEGVARAGVHDVIDSVIRQPRVRLRPWVLVVEGEALNVLRASPEVDQLLASEIIGIIENSLPRSGKGHAVSLKDFAHHLVTPGRDAVTSRVELFTPQEEQAAGGGGGGSPGEQGGGGAQAVRLNGSAVFRQNRLVGWMMDRETMGYLFAEGEARGADIPLPLNPGGDIHFSVTILRSRSEITPRVQDGRLTFLIDIQARGELAEHLETHEFADPETMARLDEILSREIKQRVEESIRRSQREFRADIFGLGEQLHQEEPFVWKQVHANWYDIYPTVEIVVNVDATIVHTGMIGNTPVIR